MAGSTEDCSPTCDLALTTIQEVLNHSRTAMVLPNTVVYIDYNCQYNCLATTDLNSSTVIIIASDKGAIMANILPRPSLYGKSPQLGDCNMLSLLSGLEERVVGRPDKFQADKTWAWVIYATMNDEICLPHQLAQVEKRFMRMGFRRWVSWPYPVEKGRYRPPNHGIVVVDGRDGQPDVYIDGDFSPPEDA